MAHLTNVEKLIIFVAKNGINSVKIHKIPSSQYWLIAEALKDGWKLYVCNPLGTSHRLVTPETVSDLEYVQFWAKLITSNITESSITNVAREYRKQLTLTTINHGPHKHNEERKIGSTRHTPSPENLQVALTKERPRTHNGRKQKELRGTSRQPQTQR